MHDPLASLRKIADLSIEEWRFRWGDFPGPEQPDFDDSDWEVVGTDRRWFPPDSRAWYRREIEVPEFIGGAPAAGARLWLEVRVDDDGIVWVDGEHRATFHRTSRAIELTNSATPGDAVSVSIQNINHGGSGQLISAELHSSTAEPGVDALRGFFSDVDALLSGGADTSDQPTQRDEIGRAAGIVGVASFQSGDVETFVASVDRAREAVARTMDPERGHVGTRLEAVARLLNKLDELIASAREAGIDVSYPLVTRTVVANFIEFARQDVDHPNAGFVRRGAAVTGYLEDACHRAMRETRALLESGASGTAITRYRTAPTSIGDGTFIQDGRPVFLTGFGHFGQVVEDIPQFQAYGFNIIQTTAGQATAVDPDLNVDAAAVAGVRAVLDRAAEHDIAVNVLLGPGMPKWAFREHPDLRNDHLRFFSFREDHPVARQIYSTFLHALIPEIAGHPALFSFDLMNEPTYEDFSEPSQERFREWLRARHGTIERVNELHDSEWTTFDGVVVPGSGPTDSETSGLYDREPGAPRVPRPLWLDWCRFNQERFLGWHTWMRDIIREHDPDTPIHAKVMGTLFDGQRWFQWGVDHEDFSRIDRISGNDNYSYYEPDEEYAQIWWRQAMYYDFQRSVAPENPIFNSENHPIEDGDPTWVSGDHMRAMLWQGAIHGQGATTTWVWERNEGGCLADNILTRPNCVEAFGRASLDLQRLAPEVVALQKSHVGAEVAILFSDASTPYHEEYLDAMRASYEALTFLDTQIRFVTEKQIADGSARMPRLLIAPQAGYVRDEAVDAVESFVRDGGTLVATGDAFAHDEYGTDRDVAFLPSSRRAENGSWTHGEGRVEYLAETPDPKALAEVIDPLLDTAGVSRPVRVLDHMRRRLWGVRTIAAQFNGRRLVYAVNLASRPHVVQIASAEPFETATDLITGLERGSLFELDPLEFVLLELGPE